MQQLCSFRQPSLRYTQHGGSQPSAGPPMTPGVTCRQLQHTPHQQCASSVPSTSCRARLPHMDEEIEHMQWQLDKRTQEDSSGRQGGKAGRGRGQQHVFHDRHATHHRRHQRHQRHGSRSTSASEGEQDSMPQPAVVATASSTSTVGESATAKGPCAGDLQSVQAVQQQQAAEQYYHLQLQASAAAAAALPKARDRLLKHILQDGGCYVSLAPAQAAALSHLLLFLQHRLVQEHQGSLLLLQPVDCERPQAPAAALAAGAGGSGSSSTVMTPAGQQRQHDGSCSVDKCKFWTTVVPLDVMLGMLQPQQQQQQAEETAGPATATAPFGIGSTNSSSVASASSTSLLKSTDSLPVESSTDEWQMPTNNSSRSGTARVTNISNSSSSLAAADAASRNRDSNGSNDSSSAAEAALLDAAGRSCSAAGALLLAALAQQRLECMHVGSHAKARSVAGSAMCAVATGKVVALHVNGSPAIHAVAYTALQQAAGQLLAGDHPCGFGVLLVPGLAHEHVHAVPQGHAAAATAAADVAAAHKGGGQHHQHDVASRKHRDASMEVGGFGAAFYGIGDSSSGRGEEHWLQHRHAQELWLCVVPLQLALAK